MPIQTRIYWLVLMFSDIMAKPVEFVLNVKNYREIIATAVQELIQCTESWREVEIKKTQLSDEENMLLTAFDSLSGAMSYVSVGPSYREQIYALRDVVNGRVLNAMRKLHWNESSHFAVIKRRIHSIDGKDYVMRYNRFVSTPVLAFGVEPTDELGYSDPIVGSLIPPGDNSLRVIKVSVLEMNLNQMTPADVAIYHQSIHATELLWQSFKDEYDFAHPEVKIDYLHLKGKE